MDWIRFASCCPGLRCGSSLVVSRIKLHSCSDSSCTRPGAGSTATSAFAGAERRALRNKNNNTAWMASSPRNTSDAVHEQKLLAAYPGGTNDITNSVSTARVAGRNRNKPASSSPVRKADGSWAGQLRLRIHSAKALSCCVLRELTHAPSAADSNCP
jgi:hypothetical protein